VAHRGNIDGEVLAALELHGEGVPAIPGGDEVHDGVQLEQAMTMVCSAGTLASCNDERRWLKLADVSARHRSWRSTTCTEGSGWW
jgi:hypothetical protein